MRGADGVEDLPGQARRRLGQRRRRGGVGGAVAQRPLPLALLQEPKFEGNVSLLSVVSIWKIFTPDSAMSRPMRQFDECSSEAGWSMKDFEWRIVCGLWWWRRLR